MRKHVLELAIIGGLLLSFVGVANARPSSPEGSIALRTEAAAATSTSGATVSYGDHVSFDTTVTGASGRAEVYVTVVCVQGLDVVYQVSGPTDGTWHLVDPAGDNLNWDGGPAECGASLQHRVKKGKGYKTTTLDVDYFSAA